MSWLRRLWQKSLTDKRLDSELQFHLEQQVADYVASGMTPEEARRRTNLEFGGVERFKEECRESRLENHIELFVRDIVFAFRSLRKDRRFTLVSILALALGIGASTAIFSVIYNALVAPFPYKDQSRLVTLRIRNLDNLNYEFRGELSYPELRSYLEQNHVFDGFVGNCEIDVVQDSGENNNFLVANIVTPGTFELFGVRPLLGRGLEPADYQAGAPPVFVLRYITWQEQFGADPAIIGKTFQLNGVQRTLVGVMPPRFAWGGAQFWMPRDPAVVDVLRGSFPAYWGVVAHLKPGVSFEEAEADLNVIAASVSQQHKEDYPLHFRLSVESFVHAVVNPDFRKTLYVLFAAVGLLLLIGCANVANLLLARSTMRSREFAVRAALGASRGRLVRQLLLESFLLALGGATLGLGFAWGGIRALSASMPPFTVPSETVIEMNAWVFLFGVGVAVVTVVVFGLVPALKAARVDVQEALREAGRGMGGTGSKSRLRSAVIVMEVALSMILLFTASLFMRSFVAIEKITLGWDAENIVTGRIPLPANRFGTKQQLVNFMQPLMQRLKSTPGIVSATTVSSTPPYGGYGGRIEIPGKTHPEKWQALIMLVSEDYFSVVRQPIISGRMFTEPEATAGQKVAVINQAFQRKYLGSGDPLGRTISLDIMKELPDAVQDAQFQVIGVAADGKNMGLENPAEAEVWIPYSVTGSLMRRIMVRTTEPAYLMTGVVRKAVWSVDPGVALAEPSTLSETMNVFSYAQPRLGFFLVSTFATVGLILVALGVYSVIAYTTSRRTHEIGIRMALGAAKGDVLRMVLRHGFTLILPGIAIGLIVSFAISRAVVSLLWGVSPYDPLAAISVVVLLFSIGLMACWAPARRATRVDPMTALRYE